MTVAVYMQVDRFFPPEVAQRVEINKWLSSNKIPSSSVQWFIDREDKLEFQQLSTDIQNGSITSVVMYSLEQGFNSLAAITAALENLASKGVAFASVSQGIDFKPDSMHSAASLLKVSLELANHHRLVRQKIGIEKAQAKGLYKGKKPGSTKPGVDIKRVVRLKEKGWSAKRIAKKMGIAESTVFRYLQIYRKQ